jgi:hypothetical protein
MLPANVRIDWKVFARCKHSSLLGLVFSNEEKKFYNIDTRTASSASILSPPMPEMETNPDLIPKHGKTFPDSSFTNFYYWQKGLFMYSLLYLAFASFIYF